MKIYTVTEKSWLRQVGNGTWVGTEFLDHGKRMEIVAVGAAYDDDGERMIDIRADEQARDGG